MKCASGNKTEALGRAGNDKQVSTKKMRIVQVSKTYWPDNAGGIGAVIKMIADMCKTNKDGQEIVVCQPKPHIPTKRDRFEGVKVYRCRQFFSIASTPISLDLCRTLAARTKRADITVYHCPYPMADAAIALRCIKSPYVVWWHADFESKGKPFLAALYKYLMRNTLRRAERIIVSGKGNIKGSDLLKKYSKKCTVIPFGVSEELQREGRKYFENREQEEKADKEIHVLFIGRIVWYKGIDVLLEAWRGLDTNRYKLTIVGDGPLYDKYKDLSVKMNLENVLFAGSVSEEKKIEWIKWCDFLILPSISKAEAFAIVQIEAMAFGKPVINTFLPSGVPDVCPDGVCGITVKPNDSRVLREAIIKLGEDEEMRDRMGTAAIERMENNYSMVLMKSRHDKLFKEICYK